MNIGILASGNLGLITCSRLLDEGIHPVFLFCDNDSFILKDLFTKKNIPVFSGNPRGGRGLKFIESLSSDVHLIVSINYLYLLGYDIINLPKFGAINIHGSLLPKYRGRTPHVWSIINNEIVSGITVHYIDAGCDSGPIILQELFTIERHFTGGDMLKEFEKKYPEMILKAINLFRNRKPIGVHQVETKATYFGKRTPADGRIDWNWQKERIYNWVRAQSNPYPGAFSFYDEHKVIIDMLEFTETGFRWDMVNGTIVTGGQFPEVKTPNGIVKIIDYRSELIFEEGKKMT